MHVLSHSPTGLAVHRLEDMLDPQPLKRVDIHLLAAFAGVGQLPEFSRDAAHLLIKSINRNG